MGLTKIQVKIKYGVDYGWSHFCYAPSDVKTQFDSTINNNNVTSNYWIRKWAEEDFPEIYLGLDITPYMLEALKQSIRERSKRKYPELYMESNIDAMGWIRLWYVNHMKKEIESYEQARGQSEQVTDGDASKDSCG